MHFFELLLDRLPELQLDNREIIGARLVLPEELHGIAVTGPVAVYLERARHRAAGGDERRSNALALNATELSPRQLIQAGSWIFST